MKKTSLWIAPVLCLAAWSTPPASAALLEGLRFDDSTRLAGSELRLNGLGLRAVFIIKGYVAGLYLHGKAASLQDAVAVAGPKRLQIRMLRDAGSEDFKRALVSGIEKNATETELLGLRERIRQLEQTIDGIGVARLGDTINLDYVPERGTTLAVNDAVKGTVIRGPDFYNALLGIFLGDNPVDSRLKQGLLGQ
jgi:hypothetical protein